ncbi:fructose-1,6-bisphosphatase [soil metagenome]
MNLLIKTLAEKYPTPVSAMAEVAAPTATLRLPRPTIHVISDIHGEHQKLRHVITTASGSLRPLVEHLFGDELNPAQQQDLLTLIYYPRETLETMRVEGRFDGGWPARADWVRQTLERQFALVRELAGAYRGRVWESLTPPHHRELFRELFNAPTYRRPKGYISSNLETLAGFDQDFAVIRAAARLVRNLSVAEIVVDGDLGDRGARLDKVIETLMQQPNVSLTWGNHDISWMGACIGQDALVATVLRICLRYLRLWQLEEGYGISLIPLEKLVRDCYADDPATHFYSKRGATTRPGLLVARMQKACAILQFKLEAQTIARNPGWNMADRILLDRTDFRRGLFFPHASAGAQVSELPDSAGLPLRDTRFPTIDPDDPTALHPAEQECLARFRASFTGSSILWDHMSYVVENGCMSLVRDEAAIFHACVPVDESGGFLPLEVEGRTVEGKPMFDQFERIVTRSYSRGGRSATTADKDWFYYLWAGPRSPLFGKDKMATFEGYFLEDKATHLETKNPYFKFIHDAAFADRICQEMGVPQNGLLVNGHIPVRPENGESPIKKGGNAVTIDGAFSEAYGDRGYTLILSPDRVALAEHHHFDSIEVAIERGTDIVPDITTVRAYSQPRTLAETPAADEIHTRIAALRELVEAYQTGAL